MELRVSDFRLPEAIAFNYEELKAELISKVSLYENLVYTETQIKEAKVDKAQLNKLKKALNDERIRMELAYMQPFNDFKAKINEIIGIIDKPVMVIDKQLKSYEEKRKAGRMAEIDELFAAIGFQPFVKLDMIFDPKWLNATTSLKKIEEDLKGKMYGISTDLLTLSNLPEFSFEAAEVYKSTLDVNKAINEGKRLSEIAKAKAEHEAEIAKAKAETELKLIAEEPQHEIEMPGFKTPAKQWVSFKAYLSTDDALALKEFFNARNIDFKPIKEG